MNLLKETLSIMKKNNQTPETVKYVLADSGKLVADWGVFVDGAEKHFSSYDSGYGCAEVPSDIVIVFKDGCWLERDEYDGSEWWEYKQTPTADMEAKGILSLTGETFRDKYIIGDVAIKLIENTKTAIINVPTILGITTDFREYFNTTGRMKEGYFPQITLVDGTTLSVQASEYNYCSPRISTSDTKEYWEFEIGFPSVEIPEINEFAEDCSDYTGTVYPYVPYEIIQKLINIRGGIVQGTTK
jgi:hypothetical protein